MLTGTKIESDQRDHTRSQDFGECKMDSMKRITRSATIAATCVIVAGAMVGCSGGPKLPDLASLNPFKQEEVKLPGKRLSVLGSDASLSSDLAAASQPIAVPAQVANLGWSQPGGTADNAPGHLQLQASLKSIWRASAGNGSSSYGKLTASPIVYEGRVYTLDAYGAITAFSATGGQKAWRFSLAPKHENAEEGFGGGLAAADGQVFAATGFGTVVALSARSGKKIWEVNLGAPARNSPTVASGKVFVSTIDGRFHALSVLDGRAAWRFDGAPQKASILSNVSPAVGDGLVIVPDLSGEVLAVNAETGETLWTDSLASSRSRSSVGAIGNPGRPVLTGGTVYAVGNAGRMIASSGQSGERLWSKRIRSIQTPWVAGDAVYIVDVSGRVMALNRASGAMHWATKLPGDGKWSGPVLAGGRLWLVSSKGKLARVDAATGRVLGSLDLGEPVFIAPVVAGGKMYILTDKARLIALR